MKTVKFLPVLAVALVLAIVAVSNLRSAASPAKDSAETLKQLEAEFMKAAAEKGSQGYMSYYADDAVELPNGAPILQGKENIGDFRCRRVQPENSDGIPE